MITTSPEQRAAERAGNDRRFLMNFFLELDDLSEQASRALRNPAVLGAPSLLRDMADRAHEFRDALLELAQSVEAPKPVNLSDEVRDVL